MAIQELKMKKYPIFRVNVFNDKQFKGNPAAVVILDKFLETSLMQKIAAENNVSETAFVVKHQKYYEIKWFTPELEMDLCGHATLAAAYVLFSFSKQKQQVLTFKYYSGTLLAKKFDGYVSLELPIWESERIQMPEIFKSCINIFPTEVYKTRDYVFVLKNRSEVEKFVLNRVEFDKLDFGKGGLIITSLSEDCDYVLRYFTPNSAIFEDPVTGSAQCSLVPIWSSKLNKSKFFVKQLSVREGNIISELHANKIIIYAKITPFFQGLIYID